MELPRDDKRFIAFLVCNWKSYENSTKYKICNYLHLISDCIINVILTKQDYNKSRKSNFAISRVTLCIKTEHKTALKLL